jgi:hypothetical protein
LRTLGHFTESLALNLQPQHKACSLLRQEHAGFRGGEQGVNPAASWGGAMGPCQPHVDRPPIPQVLPEGSVR